MFKSLLLYSSEASILANTLYISRGNSIRRYVSSPTSFTSLTSFTTLLSSSFSFINIAAKAATSLRLL